MRRDAHAYMPTCLHARSWFRRTGLPTGGHGSGVTGMPTCAVMVQAHRPAPTRAAWFRRTGMPMPAVMVQAYRPAPTCAVMVQAYRHAHRHAHACGHGSGVQACPHVRSWFRRTGMPTCAVMVQAHRVMCMHDAMRMYVAFLAISHIFSTTYGYISHHIWLVQINKMA